MIETEVKQNRRSLVLMFSIGLVPVIIAYVVFVFFPALLPTNTTNQGELIVPSISSELIGLEFSGSKWSLLILLGANCTAACEEKFYLTRQTNTALGKEAGRVKRILISTEISDPYKITAILDKYPELERADLDQLKLNEAFEKALPGFLNGDDVLLMDPNGNIMMRYSSEKLGNAMLKDLKFLLKISNIG